MNKFPSNPENGQAISDVDGNIYQYDTKSSTWIKKGIIETPEIVSTTTDGIITPEIYANLRQLSTVTNFKIHPHANKYWYYLFSKFNLLDLTFEEQNSLRIEINKSRLVSKFMRNNCIGPEGEQGIPGKQGKPGKRKKEQFVKYTNNISFDIKYDNNISLRLYDGSKAIGAELRFDINGALLLNDIYSIKVSNLTAIREANKLNISFDIEYGFPEFYKIGIVGSDGVKGPPGDSFFQVEELKFNDSSLVTSKPLVSIRAVENALKYAIYDLDISCAQYLAKNFFDNTPLANGIRTLVIDNDSSQTSAESIFKRIPLVNVNESVASCKKLGVYLQDHDEIKLRDITLPAWTPNQSCLNSTRWTNSKFTWWTGLNDITESRTDCNAALVPPSYPWTIIIPSAPEERCCQESFFWCPNVQEESCPAEIVDNQEEAMSVERGCGCDEFKKLGNYFIKSDTEEVINSINGDVQKYEYSLQHSKYIAIELKYFLECGNTNCVIDWCVTSNDDNLITSKLQTSRLESETSKIELFFKNPGSTKFKILVNTEYQNCCTAYVIKTSNEISK